MSKKHHHKKLLKANIYENDYDEIIYSTSTEISKKESKNANTEKYTDIKGYQTKKELVAIRNKIFGSALSTKLVPCTCNTCGNKVNGTLLNTIFSPLTKLLIPFVYYTCSVCNHFGHRSVQEKALSLEQFEKTYF